MTKTPKPTMTRRELLALVPAATILTLDAARPAGAAAAAQASSSSTASRTPFTLPPLPYPADALEPHIDALTMTIHHDRHHAAYVTNLNVAVAANRELQGRTVEDLVAGVDRLPEALRTVVRNQGGGHANHSLFWTSLKRGGSAAPSGDFGKAIDARLGGAGKLKDSLTAAAMGVFGSGWAWLTVDRTGALAVETTPNQDSPLTRGRTPLLGIDVWEHAYYLKYQNRRRDYVDAIFNVVDWATVQERWRAARG